MISLFTVIRRGMAFVPPKHVPVITVPKYLESRVKQVDADAGNRLRTLVRKRSSQGNRKIPIITSIKRPKLNHYYGQSYPRTRRGKENVPLASVGWRRLKYRNDEIVFRPFAKNPSYQKEQQEASKRSKGKEIEFNDLMLSEATCKRIEEMGFKKPTNIQAETIPEILDGKHLICSAETGSGKTIAYLAPLVDMLSKTAKADGHKAKREPRVMIVAPSRELAEQIGKVALKLTEGTNVGVAAMIGGAPKHLTHTGYDILITTVGLIEEHAKRQIYQVKNVKHLVLDEADTLLDDSFSFNVADLLRSLNLSESYGGVQLILVSATIPSNMKDVLDEFVDVETLKKIYTKNVHYLLPHVKQTFINIVKHDRDAKLISLVKENENNGTPTMVFANRTPMANWIHKFLKTNGIDNVLVNKSVSSLERLEAFERYQCGDVDVMTCTDLASRGLDTIRTRHVINYNCPKFVADYIHRAGRTGRMGTKGACEVTSFVSFRPDFNLLQKLEYAVRTRRPISDVNANIKKLYEEYSREKSVGGREKKSN